MPAFVRAPEAVAEIAAPGHEFDLSKGTARAARSIRSTAPGSKQIVSAASGW